jgi:hypothetical protein
VRGQPRTIVFSLTRRMTLSGAFFVARRRGVLQPPRVYLLTYVMFIA